GNSEFIGIHPWRRFDAANQMPGLFNVAVCAVVLWIGSEPSLPFLKVLCRGPLFPQTSEPVCCGSHHFRRARPVRTVTHVQVPRSFSLDGACERIPAGPG